MYFKIIGIALGAVGLAAGIVKSIHKTGKDVSNAWFYSSMFRDDLGNKVAKDFKQTHPDEELTEEKYEELFNAELDKYRKQLV